MKFNNSELTMMVISLRDSIKAEKTKLFDLQMNNPKFDDDDYIETIEESMTSQYIEKLEELLTKVNTEMNTI